MSSQAQRLHVTASADESAVRSLYTELLENWNKHDGSAFAALFAEDSNVVGFDGSQMNGRAEVESSLRQIFANHETSAYVGKIREVRFLAPDVAILRAVVGMVPPRQSDLDPAVNAIQTLVAAKLDGRWRIALFQNTPARFHGRPDAAHALTEELSELL